MIVQASVGGLGAMVQFVGEMVDNQRASKKKREKWTRNGPEMVPGKWPGRIPHKQTKQTKNERRNRPASRVDAAKMLP